MRNLFFHMALLVARNFASVEDVMRTAYADRVILAKKILRVSEELSELDGKITRASLRSGLENIIFRSTPCASLLDGDVVTVTAEQYKPFEGLVEPLIRALRMEDKTAVPDRITKILIAYPNKVQLCRLIHRVEAAARDRLASLTQIEPSHRLLLDFVSNQVTIVEAFIDGTDLETYPILFGSGTLRRQWLDLLDEVQSTLASIQRVRKHLYESGTNRSYYEFTDPYRNGRAYKLNTLHANDLARVHSTINECIQTGFNANALDTCFSEYLTGTYTKTAIDSEVRSVLGVYLAATDRRLVRIGEIEAQLLSVTKFRW